MTQNAAPPAAPHQLDGEEVLQRLGATLDQGLDGAVARQRLASVGPNELVERGGRTLWQIVWEQISSSMIVVLVVAGMLALLLQGGGLGRPR